SRSFGEGSAFWGARLLSLAPGFTSMGRLLVLDGLLRFFATLGLLAAFEAIRGERFRWGWWLVAALACALGVLTKGPVALILVAPPLWFYRRLTKCSAPLTWRAVAASVAVVLAVSLPWYVALCFRIPDFGRYFFWE